MARGCFQFLEPARVCSNTDSRLSHSLILSDVFFIMALEYSAFLACWFVRLFWLVFKTGFIQPSLTSASFFSWGWLWTSCPASSASLELGVQAGRCCRAWFKMVVEKEPGLCACYTRTLSITLYPRPASFLPFLNWFFSHLLHPDHSLPSLLPSQCPSPSTSSLSKPLMDINQIWHIKLQ